ncbi:MAG: RbsD or FucU transport [Burkholderiales bacterium]|jgi:L-fucose mutarotase|nr:RbsD or FucU transport [Burkholderiales bacterium]
MLKTIDPVLTPEVLKTLCEMGHGDEIAVVDANFCAMSMGPSQRVFRLSGTSMRSACGAVLSLFPLDRAVDCPVAFMHVGNQPEGFRSALQRDVLALVERHEGVGANGCEAVERFAFYDRVRNAYAIVQTGELEPFANFLFKKGVITAFEA